MRWRTTLTLLVVTIGVGAYISLYEIRQPSPTERERRSKQIVNVPPETVTQLVLDLPQAKVTLNRTPTGWALAPQGARANGELIDQILNGLAPLVAERILAGSNAQPPAGSHSAHPSEQRLHLLDPKVYGLEPAVGWLSVVANATPVTLYLGETTPVRGNRYARLTNRPDIFVISSSLFDTANVSPETFRDPVLIRANSGHIDGIELVAAESTVSLTRHDNEWSLTLPLADQADRTQITGFLDHLSGIRIMRFVDDAPTVEHVSEWGFDHPKLLVRLRQGAATAPVTLFFGTPLPQDASLVYAKRSDEPALYAVASADVEPLLQHPADLREKACLKFFTHTVVKVTLTHDAQAWTMERTGSEWKERGPGTALDTQRVEDFLSALSDMRVTAFVDDAPSDVARYGLAPPMGSVELWVAGHDAPQRLLIGSAVEQSQERYGRIEGRLAVVKLPSVAGQLLFKSPSELSPASPASAPSAQGAPHTSASPAQHK